MSYTDKESKEAVECLGEELAMEGAALNDGNLTLDQLAELSQHLNMSAADMEVHESEEDLHTTHEEEIVEEQYVQDDLGAHEIEIETEHMQVSEETMIPEVKVSKASVPPLRPLTIAPKPAKAVPIQIKPSGGTQLLLLQGGTVGQQIKLLSQSGQELNLSNVSIGKPITIKPAMKTLSQSGLSVIQPKQVVMKKVLTQVPKACSPKTIENKQGHVLVMQKADTPQMKLVPSGVLSGTAKSLTITQAQQMGYLTNAKLVPQVATTKQTFMVNKNQSTKSIKLIPQGKSPTKILPAPQATTSTKAPQRIFLKPTNANPIIGPSQLIQVSGAQSIGSSGQLHQINIPGKGVQYIKFIQAPQADTSATTVTTVNSIKTQPATMTNKLVPVSSISSPTKTAGAVVLSEIKKISKSNLIAPKPTKVTGTLTANTSGGGQLLVVPASYVPPATTSKVAIPVRASAKPSGSGDSPVHTDPTSLEANGMRPRKPCNCTKSQCLKLYCDCFANGEFCYMCNCMNCFNNLENEEHRQRAIKNCLERNPNAFRPKIGKAKDTSGDQAIRKHTKGCNCKRSGCLKNYCECYEAKIACSSNCKCIGCRNVEDTLEKKNIKPIPNATQDGNNQQPTQQYNLGGIDQLLQMRPKKVNNTKQAFNFITSPVIEATSLCLLSLCNDDQIEDEEEKKRQIIEEFGRCLEEIINCSNNVAVRDV